MIKKIVLLLFCLYIVLLLGFYFFQERVIFKPKKLPKDFVYSFIKEFEEVNLTTDDNSVINALHFKVKDPKGVILFFHGNKGNLQRWGNMVSPLTAYNYDVFVMDYRGYGKNYDKKQESVMYKDALLCYDYLKERYNDNKIVVYGRSIGCTFAAKVASENRPQYLIMEAPFYSLLNTVKSKFPLLPYKLLLKFKFETHKFMDKVACKTIIFHGDDDSLIPIEMGKKLYDTTNKDNTEFITVQGGTHHNLNTFDGYKGKIEEILK